jgi:putative endonuclease
MRLALPGAVHETPDRQTLGKLGEEMACGELERRGYAIIARRFRTRFGEIDIVSDDHGTIVFVEVRARKSTYRGSAAESVTVSKQRRIAAMALDYLARTDKLEARCRFDVVAIDGIGTADVELRVIQDAFQVDH